MSAVTVGALARNRSFEPGVDRQERRAGHVSVQTWPDGNKAASAPVGAALRCGGFSPQVLLEEGERRAPQQPRRLLVVHLGRSSLKKRARRRVHDHLGVLAEGSQAVGQLGCLLGRERAVLGAHWMRTAADSSE